MRGAAWGLGWAAVVMAACTCSTEVGPRDAGRDAVVEMDGGSVDAGAPDSAMMTDASDPDAGRDAMASDGGLDAEVRLDAAVPLDASVRPDAGAIDAGRDAQGCVPYCDPVSGSYYTCERGMLRCSCGPCAGGTLACC